MSYVISENISVYPSARRGATSLESRLVTESALVNIINKLIDSDGFVITKTFDPDKVFEFNIHGYYFKLVTGAVLTSMFEDASNNSTIYGIIHLAKISGSAYELSGQDEVIQQSEDEEPTVVFTGIEFSLDIPTSGDDVYYLALVSKNETGNWVIVPGSKFKFNSESTSGVVNIDGGEF